MICLFGGTFDPIHLGHLHAALSVCDALDVPQIRLILSARPSHRTAPGASIAQRWEMLKLACASDQRLVPDDREMRRSAPSFTVDTLAEIRGENPGEPLVWVIGSDAFALLASWYRWEQVLELCHLVVLNRPGHPLTLEPRLKALMARAQTTAIADLHEQSAGRILVLERDMEQVSAEAIRKALSQGAEVAHLLPAAVDTYIRTHRLYGA
ncbi:MAG: nicotinate-nucleotide adenylyltransferase [Pseudomonadales bacterium]|nr:nicotinate-nucleotide adenylyltransferase [Pseudomonadales bacterium]